MTEIAAFDRITFELGKMGGRACIRGMRITVSTIVGLLAEGERSAAILEAYPDLESEDIRQSPGLRGLACARRGRAGLSPCLSWST
jgi:uncharacterized protein (DUF433 family)